MALREVLRMGHPQLRRRANEVERLDDDTLPALVEDMLETMNACDGVGLAALRSMCRCASSSSGSTRTPAIRTPLPSPGPSS